MKGKQLFAIIGLALMFGAGNALAQGDDGDDVTEATIGLMEHLEDKSPDALINDVGLPQHLMSDVELEEDPTAAETNSEQGITNANLARNRREAGIATADDESVQGFDMREAAQGNIEDFGRSEENRPEPPDPPEPPESPGGG